MTALPQARRNPLSYVIPLYFMQALPVFLVQDVSKIIFAGLGVENQQVASWAAVISLPWSFKLLWGPLVELNSTKRVWIVTTQIIIAVLAVLAGLTLQMPEFFGWTLGVLALIAVMSATCDIATDGYYLLATERQDQAAYVGWQSTMFRLGRLFATGGIVWFAGKLIEGQMPKQTAWLIALGTLAVVYGLGTAFNTFALPRPAADQPRDVPAEENRTNVVRAALVIAGGGFLYFGLAFAFGLVGHGISQVFPLFSKWQLSGDIDMVILFFKIAKGPSLVIHACNALIGITVGSVILFVSGRTLRGTQMGEAFGTFFGQSDLWRILLFVMFYRFGEVMLSSSVSLFLMDKHTGPQDPTTGLGFTEAEVGMVNGVWGVVGIVLGGIIGGAFISRIGIRKSFWILAAAMNVPNVLYLWASLNPPTPTVMSMIMFFDQFGYGFGFAGYLICLQAIAQRHPKFTTAHYAIGTGLGALLIASAGTFSGALMASVNFPVLFTVVLLCAIPCLLTIRLIPVEDTEGIEVKNTDLGD